MKAHCPKNPSHKKFVTVAHVMQEWVVDEQGNFMEEIEDLEVTHGPHPGNIWTCHECGTDAVVED